MARTSLHRSLLVCILLLPTAKPAADEANQLQTCCWCCACRGGVRAAPLRALGQHRCAAQPAPVRAACTGSGRLASASPLSAVAAGACPAAARCSVPVCPVLASDKLCSLLAALSCPSCRQWWTQRRQRHRSATAPLPAAPQRRPPPARCWALSCW